MILLRSPLAVDHKQVQGVRTRKNDDLILSLGLSTLISCFAVLSMQQEFEESIDCRDDMDDRTYPSPGVVGCGWLAYG